VSRQTTNVRVTQFEPIPSPESILGAYPITEKAAETVLQGRSELRKALSGEDQRLVVITGPCSIHDPKSALEYAEKLAELRKKVADKLIVVMRVYFEKPRTTVGWKGLINDPHLDNSTDIKSGLKVAREILLSINELGVPCATEFLDPIVPQYISDLISWSAIGARTTESQTHRQMASGLSMPVGFKNATDGSMDVALHAMISARQGHAFVGIDMQGRTSVVRTSGNEFVHLVLRGGGGKPNYSRADIAYAKVLLEEMGDSRSIMVDCSHGNSNKDHRNQPKVFEAVLKQATAGEKAIFGVMLESHLVAGKQSINNSPLTYGQSITDACMDWQTTESLLLTAADKLV